MERSKRFLLLSLFRPADPVNPLRVPWPGTCRSYLTFGVDRYCCASLAVSQSRARESYQIVNSCSCSHDNGVYLHERPRTCRATFFETRTSRKDRVKMSARRVAQRFLYYWPGRYFLTAAVRSDGRMIDERNTFRIAA